MGIYRAEDGQYYDTASEAVGATNRYRQQQKQNQLLEEQNKLLAQQERERQLNAIHEENRAWLEEQNKKERDRIQRAHSEEMRLLSLCDEVGINKSIIDNYINYIFSEKQVEEKERKLLEENNKIYKQLENERSTLWNDEEILKKIKIIKKIKNNDLSNDDDLIGYYDLKHLVEEYNATNDKIGNGILGNIVTAILIFLFLGLFVGWWTIWPFIIFSVPIIYYLCLIPSKNTTKTKIEKTCDVELRKLKKELHNKSLDNKEEEINKKIDKNIDEHFNIMKRCVEIKLNELNEFRINHYNYKIDKLLLDMGLDKKLKEYKLKYKIISKEEAKATGDVDDYVVFFTKEAEKYN